MLISRLRVPSSSKLPYLASVAVLVASASAHSEAISAQQIEAPAACALTLNERLPIGAMYSIRGTYTDDVRGGSFLEIPKCDIGAYPKVEGDAARTISEFHEAFRKKCGSPLRVHFISGLFTGKFERGEKMLYGMNSLNGSQSSMALNFFVITAIESDDLDVNSIKCPGERLQ